MMMGGGTIWGLILLVVLLLGFAYIIWVLAAKESGNVKIVGQVIAAIIAILAVIVLIYGVVGGPMKGGCMQGKGTMMEPGKMIQPGKMMHKGTK